MNKFLYSLVTVFFVSALAHAQNDGNVNDNSNPIEEVDAETKLSNLIVYHQTFSFKNGVHLIFEKDGGVFRVNDKGFFMPLVTGEMVTIPGEQNRLIAPGFESYEADPDAKIVFVQMQDGFYAINDQGKVVRFPYKKKGNYSGTWNARFLRGQDGVEYIYLSLGHAVQKKMNDFMENQADVGDLLNTGQTYVVRDDGQFILIDHRYHAKTYGNEPEFSNDLITFHGVDGAREIDLRAFDRELKFQAPYIKPVELRGTKADPSRIVNSFSENLTVQMRHETSEYHPLDRETRDNLRRAMIKKELGSAVILGPAGSGKTELVKRFVREVALGQIPELPRSTAFLTIDASSLGAGTTFVGSMESRIKALLARSEMGPVILVMDEIHGLAGQGTHSENSNDFFQWLKPHMAAGKIKILGMSTMNEFFRAFSSDTALIQRFAVIEQKPPAPEETLEIYRAWARKNGRSIPSDEVLKQAFINSEKFNPVDAQPRKGIRILLDAFADLDLLEINRPLTVADIHAATARIQNIRIEDFEPEVIREKLVALPKRLDEAVIGQKAAKSVLIRQAVSGLLGTNDPRRPRMSVLIAGPKGVGKSELALAYAKALDLPLVRIMMNKYSAFSQPEDLLRDIKQAVEKNAFTVFLIDEVDKTPKQMVDALLDVLDNGRFELPAHSHKGQRIGSAEVAVTNASFILAGNFAVSSGGSGSSRSIGFIRPSQSSSSETISDSELREQVVRDGLSEYLLDRVQDVAYAGPLSRAEFKELIEMHVLNILIEQTQTHSRNIEIADLDKYVAATTEKLYSENLSNREALRLLNQELRTAIAMASMAAEQGQSLTLGVNADGSLSEASCEDLLSSHRN